MLARGRKFLSIFLMFGAAMLLASCAEETTENGEEPPTGEATMAPMEETAMEETGMEEGAVAPEGMIAVESDFDVDETISRVEENATAGGNMVVEAVDHAQAAEEAGLDLAPTTLAIFGNPGAGTGLIQTSRSMGVDLPQKMLAWEDESGQIWLAYNDIEYLAERHGITGMDEQIAMISENLRSLAEASASDEGMEDTAMEETTMMDETMGMEDTAMMEDTMEDTAMDAAASPEGIVTVEGGATFEESVANIEGAIEEEGLNLVASVDHSLNAASIEEELPPTTLLIFGNPEAGTPFMQSSQTVGIDLPQKMLVWVDENGLVNVSYNDPEYLAERHGLEGVDEEIEMISGVLETLAASAAGMMGEATAEETMGTGEMTAEETSVEEMTVEETTAP
ncbi:MAG: DUF302 domain-containing protein [Rubrobacter sp.]|nr:DUF302 domain-containing protein [Rubrobacter sp.]